MNYIGAQLFAVVMEGRAPEEEGEQEECVFWMMVQVFEELVPQYHNAKLDGLIAHADALDALVEKLLPQTRRQFTDVSLPMTLVASKWPVLPLLFFCTRITTCYYPARAATGPHFVPG